MAKAGSPNPLGDVGIDPLEASKVLVDEGDTSNQPVPKEGVRSLSKGGPPKPVLKADGKSVSDAYPRQTQPSKEEKEAAMKAQRFADGAAMKARMEAPPKPAILFGPPQPALRVSPLRKAKIVAEPFVDVLDDGVTKASEWMVMNEEPIKVSVGTVHTDVQPGSILRKIQYSAGINALQAMARQGVKLAPVA
jgi:hypothetical protein